MKNKWLPAFYLIGIVFPYGNIFEITKSEALHFLEIARKHFENTLILSEINEVIQMIYDKLSPNVSFNNCGHDLPLKHFELLQSKYSTNNEYGFLGAQMISDYVEQRNKTFPND